MPSDDARPLLIGGRPREGSGTLPVVFPWDGAEIGKVWLADWELLDEAVSASQCARPAMAAMPPYRRAEILLQASGLVVRKAEALARQMTLETGNAIWETRLEVKRVAEILLNAAEEARRSAGEMVPIDAFPNGEGRIAQLRRFPVGVVLAITPYNAPLLLVGHKVAAAFAAGNPCVIRPASKTPLSALSLGEIFVEAGAPEGAVSVVPCATELAERLVVDDRVAMLSFTGSAEVGWRLRRIAATPRVALELGGNGAVVIHEDADLERAAERCAFGGFLRAGQACISVQRVYVHENLFDDFASKLLERVSRLKVGNPLDDDTVIGCLVNDAAADRAMDLIEEARSGGARLLCGGGRQGRVVEPTLIVGAAERLRVCAEEAFAPVVTLNAYSDVGEALARANGSQYGLQAGLFTNDVRLIERAFRTLEVGALIVNDVNTFRVDHMPYGGVKRSGLGREGIRYAMREMTEERLLVVDPR